MKTYTSEELAQYAKQFALQKFKDADSIYAKFRSDLNRRMKKAQPTIPLPEELERQARVLAGKAYELLTYFSEEAIDRKLDPRFKNDAWHPGIEINNYDDYFTDFATEMMKASIGAAYQPLAKNVADLKKRNRKR